MSEQSFIELSLVILMTVIICGTLRALKQPILIGYILSGLILSPNLLNLVSHSENLATYSQIGITFLLFLVGLGLNPHNIKEIGKTALTITVLQLLLCFSYYFGLTQIFHLPIINSLYLSVGLSFSSTIVIMKLLSDRLTLETLPGKITVGVLIIQDLIAMVILMIISASSKGGDLATTAIFTVSKGLVLLVALFFISTKLLPFTTKKIASSQEMLLLFSISWCMALASLFYAFGFSIEIGSLLAGVTLSLSPYRHEINAKIRPLRDFFVMIFFILLGMQINFADLQNSLLLITVLSLSVLIINPLIITAILSRLGYTSKTSFQSGVNFSQISEFSLILTTLGIKVGHLEDNTLSILTIITLITITGSTYFINYQQQLLHFLKKPLKFFEKKGNKLDQNNHFDQIDHQVIIFGYSKLGPSITETLTETKKSFFIIDYDPKHIQSLNQQNINCLYADASNSETYNEINFSKTQMVISTIKDLETNILLINQVKKQNSQTIIIALSHQIEEALTLYELGANYVIMPYFLGGHHTSTLIAEYGFDLDKFSLEKQNQLSKLLIKKEIYKGKK